MNTQSIPEQSIPERIITERMPVPASAKSPELRRASELVKPLNDLRSSINERIEELAKLADHIVDPDLDADQALAVARAVERWIADAQALIERNK